ncbi:acetyl-CoA carboxylase biotin carboxyl carrier protein subunit [Bacteroidales bacterium]|nr:acetyl-CoA carboxylase biotin carboxyl carrier protein subunit [Bacteroidales bacterium]
MADNNLETLNIHGTLYKTRLTEKYLKREKYQKPDEREIYSFIPGTVIKFFVKEGQKVQEGEPLLLLKAMKMDNKILSPFDGTIKSIKANLGDQLPKGTLLIVFE